MTTLLAPYAAQHADLQGEGDARPTARQIVRDQGLEQQLAGKTVLVTGCSPDGLGEQVARALHTTGADVYMTVRDADKGARVAAAIRSDGRPGRVEVLVMDLGSLASVRAAADAFLARERRLDVLVNNAGVMACPEGATADGHETQFGTNHLGHFLLFQRLQPALLAAAAEPGDRAARVVAVSSSGHRANGIFPGDYALKQAGYAPWKAYGQSKTANIYFANELDRRYNGRIRAFSLNPGGIWTPLQRHIPGMRDSFKDNAQVSRYMKSTEQGAATAVWAALAKELEGKGGLYLEDCAVSGPAKPDFSPIDTGYVPHAFDKEMEARLWQDSLAMVGMPDN